jgi:hypothetical protein
MSARFIAQGALVEWSQLQLFKATSGKIKTCQRPANGANDVPIVPFIYIQKFGTKFSTLGAN